MITSPKGFKSATISCGIKKSGKPDLVLIYSEKPATVAATYTSNQVKAAPIIVSQMNAKKGKAQAIIANSGNANCWTGKQGMIDAKAMANETAKALGIKSSLVLVASTGVIGHVMPMDKIIPGIKTAAGQLSYDKGSEAAVGILTTDLRPKEISIKVGNTTIAGIAKGSGMIAPGMATMFAFITTDAQIEAKLFQKLLKSAVEKSFNMVSVDNCMSTNDCVFALANGMAGKAPTKEFATALDKVCIYLAKEIARDGEGATKLLEVRVKGAKGQKDARDGVKALIGSFLLKAAVYGKDKNFGRILQALGTTKAKVNWNRLKWDWELGDKEDVITVDLAAGKEVAVGWGCDLTEGYVEINAKYHT
ncbi:MAG: bifunctional glutamate N-acetyltransferase/amino-acid acetyltransferase ArgJ [Candidatus Margulisiibacteriota bacterium]